MTDFETAITYSQLYIKRMFASFSSNKERIAKVKSPLPRGLYLPRFFSYLPSGNKVAFINTVFTAYKFIPI